MISVSGLPREVKVAISASFFVAIGFGIVLPAIPVFARSFGVNNAAIGLIVSAFAIARFSSGLVSGRLVDRFGERIIFSTGVGLVSLSTLLAGLAVNYHQLLIFRAAGGLGSSMFSVAAGSVILRATRDDQRAQAQSVYNGAFLLGGMAGPAVGGALATISLRAPFFTYSFMLAISGLVAARYLTGKNLSERTEGWEKVGHTSIREALRIKSYRYALIISFCASWVLFGLRSSIIPIFVTESLGSTAAIVGYGFTIAALAQGLLLLPAGKLSDTYGRHKAAQTGSALIAIGIVLLIFTLTPWMFLLAMAFMGLGGAYLSTTPSAIVGDVIEGKSGQVIATFQMAGDAGMIVGPIVVGYISDLYSFRAAFIATALIFSVAIVLSARLPETRRKQINKFG